MKRFRKILAVALCVCLCATLFAGCSKKQDSLVKKITGTDPGTTVLTINGADISAELYYYWVSIVSEDVSSYYTDGIVWDEIVYDDVTVDQYVKDSVIDTLVQYQMIRELLDEYPGIVDETALKTYMDEVNAYNIEMFGSEKEFEKSLAESGVSKDTLLFLYETQYYYTQMQEKLYGEGGPIGLTDADVQKYIDENYGSANGQYAAKHILVSTRDENDNDLPEDQKAEKKALAEDILAKLRASDDPATLFDSLRTQYSEDPGQPDQGYTFGPGDMVDEFYTATVGLEEYAISELVPTKFGYHIIMRLPSYVPTLAEAKAEYPAALFDKMFGEKTATAKVEYASVSLMDPSKYYAQYLTA